MAVAYLIRFTCWRWRRWRDWRYFLAAHGGDRQAALAAFNG